MPAMPDGRANPVSPEPANPALPADSPECLLGLGAKLKRILEDVIADTPPAPPDAPQRIGRYRILRLIGEGGMGSVFEAEQDQPRRRVALKVIKPGMDTRQVIRRFEAERESLGLMDHPHIARVYDAGATDAGRPFFAMELVDGVPITDHCDAHRLTVRQRLELFIPVCRAVQHAHQKAIIHRDLKPTNVLVTSVDGRPAPKVIDFGIAKAVHPRPSEQTALTEHQQLVGTPEYMSPEQAGAGGADVDTRSDVYALGVLLYELLTGTTPFAHKQLRSLAYEEARRIIREAEPPRPSTRLSVAGADAAAHQPIAAARRTDPTALRRSVRGDLDWIVMKCLEKDRNRRYETANELAADLERQLRDEPVHAGPPTASYRLRKFARRHRTPLAAAATIAVLIIATITGTTIGMIHARAARAVAEREAEKSRATEEFLQSIFLYADPEHGGGGPDSRVADMLERAAADMSEKLKGQPEVELRACYALMTTFWSLGLQDQHNQILRRAYDLVRETGSQRTAMGLDIIRSMAEFHPDLPDREAIARAAATDAEQILGHHKTTVWAQTTLALVLMDSGKTPEAETILRSLVDLCRERPVPDVNPFLRLGILLADQNRLPEAEQRLQEADAWAKEHRPKPRHRLRIAIRLARILLRQDKAQKAADVFDAAWTEFGGRVPAGDREMVDLMHGLVVLFHNQSRQEYAGQLYSHYKAALTSHAQRPAIDAPALERRAWVRRQLGEWRAAAKDYDLSIDLDPSRHEAWMARAGALANADERQAYEAHCRRMLERFGATTDRTLAERTAKICLLLPRPADECRKLVELADRAVDRETPHPHLRWFQLTKGMAEYRAENHDDAVEWLTRARGELIPEGQAEADLFLAMAHHRAGRRDDALAALARAGRIIDRSVLPPELGPPGRVPKAHLLQREANALILGDPATAPTTQCN